MPTLDTLIARTQAAIDTETDPRKLRPLQANLAAFLATKAEMDGDDDEDDDGEDDEDSKAKKAAAAAMKAKGKAEAAKHRAKAAEHKAKAAESEEAAKKCEMGDDEEESEESSAVVPAPAHGALLAKLASKVAEMERTQAAGAKTSLIDGARKLGAITKAEAAWLGAQALGAVETFLEMRSKAGLVATSEEALIRPKDVKPGTEESLPAETLQMIDAAVNVWTGDKKTYREELVKNHLAAHTKQVNAALNGAGRY